MAFNISITKKGRINWNELLTHCKTIDRDLATIYPIQRNGILEESGIGISINIRSEYGSFWDDLSEVLNLLIEEGFQVVELYDGTIINHGQIDKLKEILGG